MNSNIPQHAPTKQQHAIATLGFEDEATRQWHAACGQAVQQLTSDSGRFAGTDQARLARALDLAQHGNVTLSEDLDEYTAEVQSGKQTYTVNTANLTCPCEDFRKRQLPCKHVIATEIHTAALGLYGLAEEPLTPPAPAPALTTCQPPAAPTAEQWATTDAPASMNVKLRLGSMELWYTARDRTDHALQDRMTKLLPWLAEVMAACEANYEARQKAARQAEAQAKATPPPAPERTLQEEIAAAVAAAMQAQTKASANGHSQPAAPEAQAQLIAAPHEPSWCAKHQVTMKWRDGNSRGPGWFSHQLTDGTYCKGR